jgi:hypothetical protein
MKNARSECVGVFEIIKKQYTAIDNIENGDLNGGIKSYNIPK